MSRMEDHSPERPGFISGLPQRDVVPRPRTVAIARWAVVLSAIVFLVASGLALTRQASIRATLRADLSDRAPDYSASDIDKALIVTLAAIGIAGLLLVMFELSATTALRRRGSGGRTVLIVLTAIHLPIMLISHGLRGGTLDLGLTAAQGALLVIAAVAAMAPRTRRWLRAKPPLAVPALFGQQREAGTRADS